MPNNKIAEQVEPLEVEIAPLYCYQKMLLQIHRQQCQMDTQTEIRGPVKFEYRTHELGKEYMKGI